MTQCSQISFSERNEFEKERLLERIDSNSKTLSAWANPKQQVASAGMVRATLKVSLDFSAMETLGVLGVEGVEEPNQSAVVGLRVASSGEL